VQILFVSNLVKDTDLCSRSSSAIAIWIGLYFYIRI